MALGSFISHILGFAGTLLKKDLSSYSALETVDGSTIIAKDGSLASVVRVDGTKKLVGTRDLARLTESIASRWNTTLSRPGHAIQVWFSRDPDFAKQLVVHLNSAPKMVAKSLDLSFEDVFEARENHLPKFIVQEGFYIVLWTRLNALSAQERKKAKLEMTPPKLWPGMADTQNVFLGAQDLVIRHDTFVRNFVHDLAGLEIRAEILEGGAAIAPIRSAIYPDMVNSNWRPHLPGDEGRNMVTGEKRQPWQRLKEIGGNDVSNLLWPQLDEQLFNRPAEILNQYIVRIGAYLFAGVDMTVGPTDLYSFSDMLNRMSNDEFPWRVSFLIEGDGLASISMKDMIASILQIASNDNKLIHSAVQMLREMNNNNQGPMVRLRTSFATWADGDNRKLVEQRAARLMKAVESWGGCLASMSAGDPLAGVMSSSLGLDTRSTAPAGVPPLRDAITLLPWMRDASPFETGSVLFRTPDGRPWLFQPGSTQQDNAVDIIYAVPGKGKSVYMNTTNLAFCLSAIATSGSGGMKLPRIAILDIGPSSSGLISLLKEALPPERRHEAEYTRLRNIREHAINAFDTQLGVREPLPLERDFLVNFLTVLGTPIGQKEPPTALPELAGLVINEVYKKLSDKTRGGTPKNYTPGLETEVDDAIKAFDIRLGDAPTWWQIVDLLFGKGRDGIRPAQIAQRHAVPQLMDVMAVLKENAAQDMFGNTRTDHNQLLIDVFYSMLNSVLRDYQILSDVTRFDLGDARVVSLDLDEIAPRGGPAADKQAAIAYMLGRYVLAKDFYLNDELLKLDLFPPMFKAYHETRIRRVRETPKKLCFDEFHRTRSTPAVRNQVVIDMREGRKWGVQVCLASQLLDDFDEGMVSLATGIWIMGVNAEKDADEAQKVFGLSQTARDVVANHLRGPGPSGAPFLAILEMRDGRHEHMLYNTLSPVEVWAFSTTAEDVSLRNRLYNRIGAVETRRRLAKRFPSGSAKREIQRRTVAAVERGGALSEVQEGFIEEIALEIERAA